VLVDNVVTTGETLKSVSRLLHAHAPSLVIKEAIVMWTEGAGAAFHSIPIFDGRQLPIVSVGGHIPLFTTEQLHKYAAQQQQQHEQQQHEQQPPIRFKFKSSAQFPCHFNPSKPILFSVFQDELGAATAVALVGPSTFSPPLSAPLPHEHEPIWKDVRSWGCPHASAHLLPPGSSVTNCAGRAARA
jgi:hypothetical protein